jgi:hypothetical protein
MVRWRIERYGVTERFRKKKSNRDESEAEKSLEMASKRSMHERKESTYDRETEIGSLKERDGEERREQRMCADE